MYSGRVKHDKFIGLVSFLCELPAINSTIDSCFFLELKKISSNIKNNWWLHFFFAVVEQREKKLQLHNRRYVNKRMHYFQHREFFFLRSRQNFLKYGIRQ